MDDGLERLTALIPYGEWEYRWARERPPRHRTPVPAVGDEVDYRHDPWAEPSRAEVLAVQPLDDITDPNLWTVETRRDGSGQEVPLLVEDRPVLRPHADPWPLLTLRTVHGVGQSREARLRGSAGWLPLDWRTRYRPLPAFVGPDGRPATFAPMAPPLVGG